MYFSYVLPALVAFAIAVILGPFVLPLLLRLKIGQTIRDEGPESHLKKNGTPTMGGVLILIGLVVSTLVFAGADPKVLAVLLLTLAFGVIGFVDDFIKVVLKRSLGLRAWQKMAMQIVVTAIFAWYLVAKTDVSMAFLVPFTNYYLDFGWFNFVLIFFVIIGTVNGTNFTDGLDGLATKVTICVAIFFGVASIALESHMESICFAMAGALLGFLVFNAHPAKVFMGDTGSLALGGFVGGLAYMMHLQLFIVIVGFIYLAEVVSVIMQVSYFKLTHGKRIFKMAPIHHHFELCGLKETKVVSMFTIVTAVLCLVGIMAL